MIAEAYGVGVASCLALAAASVASRARERTLVRLGARRVTGSPSHPRVLLALRSPRATGITCLLLGGWFGWFLAGPVGVLAGMGTTAVGLKRFRARRSAAMSELEEGQVAEMVSAMAAAMRAGRSLRGALSEAAGELEPPLGPRVAAALRRLDVGEPLDRAFTEVSGASPDARLVAALLGIQARAGGDLPQLLDEVAEIVVRRIEARRQARALAAQARASGAVLAALPVAFVGLLSGMGGDGLGAFYRTPAGGGFLLSGLVLEWMGFLWLRRIAASGERT